MNPPMNLKDPRKNEIEKAIESGYKGIKKFIHDVEDAT
jgi:hypothetical protein